MGKVQNKSISISSNQRKLVELNANCSLTLKFMECGGCPYPEWLTETIQKEYQRRKFVILWKIYKSNSLKKVIWGKKKHFKQ